MAYKRSITSSDDDSTGPKFSKAHSDSAESIQSGCSTKHEGLFDYIGPSRRYRRPESPSPSPVESSEEDKENIHPALKEVERRGDSEEEEDTEHYPTYLEPPVPIQISSDSLQSVIQRLGAAASSSYSGPPGFGAGSSAAAMLQHHLNEAHNRIEQLEVEAHHRQYAQGEVDRVNGALWLAVGVLVVMVAALLVRGWL